MNGLRSHIKTSRVFHQVSKDLEVGQKTQLYHIFSTHLLVFGYPDETLFLVFDILQEIALTC